MGHTALAAARWGLLVAAGLLSSCSVGITDHQAAGAPCTSPVRGRRYEVCGQLTTGGAGAAGKSYVLGAVNATTPTAAQGRYQLSGGTFHASH